MSTLWDALPQFFWIVVLCTSLSMLVSLATYAVAERWPALARTGSRMAAAMATSFVASFTLIVSLLASHMVNDLNKAHEHLRQEMEAIVTMHQVGLALNPVSALELQRLQQKYLHEVIELEWPRMARGGSPAVDRTLYDLQLKVMQAGSNLPRAIERPLSGSLRMLIENRGSRLSLATANLPAIVWLALTINVAMTIVFLSLLQGQNRATGLLTVGLLSVSTGTLLAVVFLLDNPYVGGVFIGPDLLRETLAQISQVR